MPKSTRPKPAPYAAPTKPLTNFPMIGVVTPVRNRSQWSTGFAQRFARQDYPLFRHYIVDSASTDGTPAAIAALGLRMAEVLHAPSSAYWTAATNVGVRKALADGCDFILTINDDAVIDEDFLTQIVTATVHGKAEIVGSVIAYAENPALLWGVGAYNDFENGNFVQTRWGNQPIERLLREKRETNGLLKADYLCGNGTLVHRSVFERIGLYDERNTPHYHADTELTMRAEKAGIARFVAPEARVYNRFTDDVDGPMSPKNRRLFSLRSANYIKPIIFIVMTYCRQEWRLRALLNYLAPHLERLKPRQRSAMLRMAAFLAMPDKRTSLCKRLVPGSNTARNFAEDIALLRQMHGEDFALTAYAYFQSRILSKADRNAFGQRAKGLAITRELNSLVRNPAFATRDAAFARFAEMVVNPGSLGKTRLAARHLSTAQAEALEFVISNRSPRDSLRAALSEWRDLAARLWPPGRESENGERERLRAPRVSGTHAGVPTVYFNVDVLCMAQLDPKAATGVYRYASSVFEELVRDRRIVLRTFYSPELETGYIAWQKTKLGRSALLLPLDGVAEPRGVAFYPYFPSGKSDPRIAHLPTALTICDLFPLVKPEWFSEIAVANFRRQLHMLPSVQHFFCISRATQEQLHETFPMLDRARSSVAHLAASLPAGLEPPPAPLPRRFFLCVGTIEPRKNLKTVIEAFALLAQEAGDLHMVVAGQEGWRLSRSDLHELAGDMAGRISFLGRLTDQQLHACYRSAQFMVFASLAEGFGLPIIEAFLHGTPVITSRNSSMAEIGDGAALMVDPLDRADLARAIGAFATDEALRRDYATRGRERAKRFSWAHCAELHVREFIRLAQSPVADRNAP